MPAPKYLQEQFDDLELPELAVMIHSYLEYLTPNSNPYLHHPSRYYLVGRRHASPLMPNQYVPVQAQITKVSTLKFGADNSSMPEFYYQYANRYEQEIFNNKKLLAERGPGFNLQLRDKFSKLFGNSRSQGNEYIARRDATPSLGSNPTPEELYECFKFIYEYVLNCSDQERKQLFRIRQQMYFPFAQIKTRCYYSMFLGPISSELPSNSNFLKLWENFNPRNILPWSPARTGRVGRHKLLQYYYNPEHIYPGVYTDPSKLFYCNCQSETEGLKLLEWKKPKDSSNEFDFDLSVKWQPRVYPGFRIDFPAWTFQVFDLPHGNKTNINSTFFWGVLEADKSSKLNPTYPESHLKYRSIATYLDSITQLHPGDPAIKESLQHFIGKLKTQHSETVEFDFNPSDSRYDSTILGKA